MLGLVHERDARRAIGNDMNVGLAFIDREENLEIIDPVVFGCITAGFIGGRHALCSINLIDRLRISVSLWITGGAEYSHSDSVYQGFFIAVVRFGSGGEFYRNPQRHCHGNQALLLRSGILQLVSLFGAGDCAKESNEKYGNYFLHNSHSI